MPHNLLSQPLHTERDSIQRPASRLARWIGLCCLVVLCIGASGLVHPHAREGAEPIDVQWVTHGEQRHYAYLPGKPRVHHPLNGATSDAPSPHTVLLLDDDPLAVHDVAFTPPCVRRIGRASWRSATAVPATPCQRPPARAPPNMLAV